MVTASVDGDVLTVLARAETEFTPPQIHGLLDGRSVEGVRKALARLTEQGIVLHRSAGIAGLYQLNRDHLAASAIIAMAALCDTFLARVRDRIAAWDLACPYAALFGSAARGTMRPDSDIDIFIVRPAAVDPDDDLWREQLEALSRDASRWTGNDTRVLEFGDEEVSSGLAAGDQVLSDIAKEGVRLAGPSNYLRNLRRP